MQSCGSRPVCDSDPLTSTQDIFTPAAEAQATVSIELTGPIDPYRFNMFMADLLAERGSDIKRMSGVLSVQVGYCSVCCCQCLPKLECICGSCIIISTTTAGHCNQHTRERVLTLLQALQGRHNIIWTTTPCRCVHTLMWLYSVCCKLYASLSSQSPTLVCLCSVCCKLSRATATMEPTSSLRVPKTQSHLGPPQP